MFNRRSPRALPIVSVAPSLWWLADGVAAIAFAAALSMGAAALLPVGGGPAAMGTAAWAALALLLIGGVRGLLGIGAAAGGARAAHRAKAAWRARLYPHSLTTPPARYGGADTATVAGDTPALLGEAPDNPPALLGEAMADAIDRIEDIDGWHARFQPLRRAAVAGPLLIGVAAMAGSWVAGAIMLATLIPFALGMALAGSAAARAADRQVAALSRLSGLFVDRVRALPIIAAFGAADRVTRQMDGATRDVAARSIAVLRIAFLSSAILDFFAAISVALVAVYCGFSLLGLLPFPAPERLTLAGALFALALAPEFYLPLRRLAAAYHDKQVGDAAMARLAQVPGEAADATPPPRATATPPEIRLDRLVIDHGEVRIGPITALFPTARLSVITGASGSGKSSIINMLLGISFISGGTLQITGMAADLRGAVGWAGQTLALVPGTLADNLRLANPAADDAALTDAVRRAGLAPMLAARGADLSLPLDARGSGLSGGERRRIGIARVLLADAPLWLLDEPTADLDEASAAAIRAIIRRDGAGRTVIVATHDPLLVAMADARLDLP
jgi:ATP-binding cassette subfamily C protein CydD